MIRITRLETGFAPFDWRFETDRGEEIAAHFSERQRRTPELWNGRVLLMRDMEIAGGVLRGSYFETSYAAFLAWCDWGFPDRTINNCFPAGALRTSDGAFLLGVMNDHTAHPGNVYFPAGMPDRNDVVGDRVDLKGNVLREIAEETGLTVKDFSIGDGWSAVTTDAPHINVMKPIHVRYPAEQARTMMLGHLAREANPELKDIRIVRSADDVDSHVPGYARTYISHEFQMEIAA